MDDWLAVLIHSNNVVKRNHPIRWTENKTLVPTKTLVKMANMLCCQNTLVDFQLFGVVMHFGYFVSQTSECTPPKINSLAEHMSLLGAHWYPMFEPYLLGIPNGPKIIKFGAS